MFCGYIDVSIALHSILIHHNGQKLQLILNSAGVLRRPGRDKAADIRTAKNRIRTATWPEPHWFDRELDTEAEIAAFEAQ